MCAPAQVAERFRLPKVSNMTTWDDVRRTTAAELEELLVEAWLARAPKRLAKEYIDASK